MTWTQSTKDIDAAAANGFHEIYITIDDYLSIYRMPEGTAKTAALSAYNDAVYKFIAYAHQKQIAVDAEAGDRNWAQPDQRYKAYAVLDFVKSFNNTHGSKFRNVQYDIEPYLLPEYETGKAPVLTDYVGLVNELVARNNSGAGLTMVIPHFYGSLDGWTPAITYNGQTGSTFTLLLKALDSKPQNSLILMAYRNYAAGSGGTIDIASDELSEASQGVHHTKVVIAQETGNVDPGYVTFFGLTRSYLFSQTAILNAYFSTSTAFGGIAIHYLDPFLALQ